MRKEPGKYLIECYDELGHKVSTLNADNLHKSESMSDDWCNSNDEYGAVILRVIKNSKFKGAKY